MPKHVLTSTVASGSFMEKGRKPDGAITKSRKTGANPMDIRSGMTTTCAFALLLFQHSVFVLSKFYPHHRYVIQRSGGVGDGGKSVGDVVTSFDSSISNCGSFFGSCSNVFLLILLALTLGGGIWLVRSIMKKRYARVGPGLEYDAGDDDSEA